MIAPSEKHLEDWIAGNLEELSPYFRLLDRQLRLPSGTLDLLMVTDTQNRLEVIELKQGSIDTKTVIQVLRYMNDLQGIYQNITCELLKSQTIEWEEFDWLFNLEKIHIQGMVIGHSIQSDHILYACEAANITVMTYEFDGSGYEFSAIASPSVKLLDEAHKSFHNPQLELAVKDIMFHELTRAREAGQL